MVWSRVTPLFPLDTIEPTQYLTGRIITPSSQRIEPHTIRIFSYNLCVSPHWLPHGRSAWHEARKGGDLWKGSFPEESAGSPPGRSNGEQAEATPCIDRTAVPFGRSMDRKHAELSQPPDSLPGQSGPTRSPIIRRLNWSALGRKVS